MSFFFNKFLFLHLFIQQLKSSCNWLGYYVHIFSLFMISLLCGCSSIIEHGGSNFVWFWSSCGWREKIRVQPLEPTSWHYCSLPCRMWPQTLWYFRGHSEILCSFLMTAKEEVAAVLLKLLNESWRSHSHQPRDGRPCAGNAHRGKKKRKKKEIQVEGQRFFGGAFPWCIAPRQLRRPVNTPVTDVIMALLRYRTTRSFCWTKTSLSPHWPADPDTTPAGSDVTFIWDAVQLTFDVPGGGEGGVEVGKRVAQRAMFHLANGRHNDTHTGFKQKTPNMAWWATPGANGHPMALACGHRGGRCEMFFPVVGVYEHLHAGILTCICNSTSAPIRQLMGKTLPSLKRLPTFWAHLVLESTAAVAELWLRQRGANEVSCLWFHQKIQLS